MRLLLVLLRFALSCGVLGFAAAGAVAQPLPRTPEALKTVAARLHAAGFFNAAAHDDVRRQITAGRIDSRADLLSEAARALTPTGPSPGWLPTAEPDPAAIESGAFLDALLPNPDTLRASVGRLATTGAVSDRTHRRLVAFVDEVEAYADTLRTVLAQGGGISVYPGAHLPATLLHEIELLQLAATLTETEERMDPARAAPFLDALVAADVLRPEERARLSAALEAGTVAEPADVLRYTARARRIDLRALPDDDTALTAALLDALTTLLRESGVARVAGGPVAVAVEQRVERWVPDEPDTLRTAVLSATLDGQRYETAVFGGYEGSPLGAERGVPDTGYRRALADGVRTLLNRALRDGGSPYRLSTYVPEHTDLSPYAPRDTVVFALALTRAQAALLFNRDGRPAGAPLNPFFSYAHFEPLDAPTEPTFTTTRVRAVVERLRALGVLDGIPPDTLAGRLRVLERRYVAHPHGILDALGLVLRLDWEMSDATAPYRALLESLAALSRGAFRPESIEDGYDYDAERVPVAFTLGGQRYSATMEVQGDWYDPAVFDLIERAMTEAGVEGRFLYLSPGYDTALVFLTEPQRQALEADGLLFTLPDPD